ncbi:MAG: transposase [Butyrivibrio sp.]|nr:transposase [Butyrivibrio sp.]
MTNPQNNVTNGINLLSREELEKQNRILSQQLAETKAKLNWYEEQYRLSKEKQFGRSSEKDLAGQMNLSDVFPLFNEAETFREMINTEPKEEDLPSEQDSDEGKRKRRKKDIKNLTVAIDTYELPIEDQICPKCGAPLHVMKEKLRTEIEIKEVFLYT